MKRGSLGFTLIELMVTVALVALLAKLAYPYFGAQLDKGRIAKAIGDITQLQIDLERYFTANGKYPADLARGSSAKYDQL